MAFAPDGKTLAVSCGTVGQAGAGRIVLWDVESGKKLGTLVGHTNAVSALAISPDGKLLASSGYDRTMRLWDLNSRKELHQSHCFPPASELTFSRDGKTLISSSPENHIRLWDVTASAGAHTG